MKRLNFTLILFFLVFSQLSLHSQLQQWWEQNGNDIYNTNSGNVGIGTSTTYDKLTLNGGMTILNPSNSGKRLTMGVITGSNWDYVHISTYNPGGGNPLHMILGAERVGINTGSIAPIQRLDVGDKLCVRNGVIQDMDQLNPTAVTGTSDLGLYSQRNGYHMRFVTYNAPIRFFTDAATNLIGSTATMVVHNNGSVGIGTESPSSTYKLSVNGKIRAKEIKVESNWSDFVFKSEYNLRTLEEVENYIKENGHLPEIPSEKEVTENGVELGDMTAKLLQKIEELTLYIIELQKDIENLKEKINEEK
ncbi:MAG: hypothetical protein L0Y79_08470 [Chlorobi bacterium]|nr:hypothetical protein [Chlorobiota bacterium]MCI0716608.1 hypothetical protein [Chlorobiota bacterium]